MKKILTLSFLPINHDLALLIFRIWVSLSLFTKHGIEKFVKFDEFRLSPTSLDPLHIGVLPTLCYATFTDGICSLLIMLGLFTRLSAVFLVATLMVVFCIFHGASFMEEHAEIAYLYLASYIYLACVGGGKYSLDNRIFK